MALNHNPTQVKQNKIPTISLRRSTTLTLSLFLTSPPFVAAIIFWQWYLGQVGSTQQKHSFLTSSSLKSLTKMGKQKKYSFWLWLTHGLIGKYMWNSWVDLDVNIWFGSNFVFRTIKVKRKDLFLRSLAWNGDWEYTWANLFLVWKTNLICKLL